MVKRRPCVAIVGSFTKGRTYDPPIKDPDEAAAAGERLGVALARSDFRLLVFSATEGFLDGCVVKGYASEESAQPKSIEVQFSHRDRVQAMDFPEKGKRPELFDPKSSSDDNWEVSYYTSILRADAIVLMGGANAALITGVLARATKIPILALAAYGGSASKVWASLVPGLDLTDETGKEVMAEPLSAESEAAWIDSLRQQMERRKRNLMAQRERYQVLPVLGLVLLWIASIPAGLFMWTDGKAGSPGGTMSLAFFHFFFFAPVLAGMAGACVRRLVTDFAVVTLRSGVTGAAAGAIVALLYVIGQVVTNPEPYTRPVYLVSVVFGFIAGFTSDAVFKKLETAEVTRLDSLSKL